MEDTLSPIINSALTQPVTIVKAPPGAGKSYLNTLVAGASCAGLGHKVAVATPTREQGLDLAQDIAAAYSQVHLVVHAPAGTATGSLPLVPKAQDLPQHAHVAVGTVAKWGFYPAEQTEAPYDLLIVDEAYQLTDAAFATIAHLAQRILLVGDPGQIKPVITVQTPQWETLPDAPTAPAPQVLVYRHPATPVFHLPNTRRFGTRTAQLVSQYFYDFPWGSVAPKRSLEFTEPTSLLPGWDPSMEYAASVLPAEPAPRHDPALASHIASLVHHIQEHGRIRTEEGGVEPVGTVYVGCAHIDQVAAARAACAGLDVVVDTAERLQGRQANVVLFWHPATNLETAGDFQRDTGRLCVLLSRHKAAVIMVTRSNIMGTLDTFTSNGRSTAPYDDAYRAWATTRAVTRQILETSKETLTV